MKRALFGGLGALGLWVLGSSLAPKPVPVDVAPVERGPLRVTVDEDGRTRVEDRYVVTAPVTGRLARIGLEPGDEVRTGDVLARIVPTASPLLDPRARSSAEARVAAAIAGEEQARARVARAEAAQRFARAELERFRRLAEEEVIAPRELDRIRLEAETAESDLASARFAHQVARHELEMAKAALGRVDGADGTVEHLEVPAPVDGRVLEVMRESEGAVTMGSPLLELGDPSDMEVVVDVLTRDAVEIQPGAHARLDRWGGAPVEARVRQVEPSAFTKLSALGVEEQRVNVVLDLDDPPSGLGDGFRVEARITVWSSDDALHVPASAVFRRDDGWAVYSVREGQARLTAVEVGRRTGRRVQIVEGLQEGDEVVVHPSDAVEDGRAVAPRQR